MKQKYDIRALLHQFQRSHQYNTNLLKSIFLSPNLGIEEAYKTIQICQERRHDYPLVFYLFLSGVAMRGNYKDLTHALTFVNNRGIKSEVGGWRDVFLLFHSARRDVPPALALLKALVKDQKIHSLSPPMVVFCLDKIGSLSRGALELVSEACMNSMKEREKQGKALDIFARLTEKPEDKEAKHEGSEVEEEAEEEDEEDETMGRRPRNKYVTRAVANSLIGAWVRTNESDKAEEIFWKIKEKGIIPSTSSFLPLVQDAIEKNDKQKVEFWLNEIKTLNLNRVPVYNILITESINNNKTMEAVAWFNEMEKEGMKGNVVIYTTLITGFARLGHMGSAKYWIEKMRENKMEPDVITYTSLISSARTRNNEEALEEWVKEMKERGVKPSITTYTVLLSYAIERGEDGEVEKWLEEMDRERVRLDETGYHHVIMCYAREGDEKRMQRWIELMKDDGWKVDAKLYQDIVKNKRREGRKAVETIEDGEQTNLETERSNEEREQKSN